MNKMFLVVGASLLMGGLSAQSPYEHRQQQMQMQNGQVSPKCSHLNNNEMDFAKHLSPMQMAIFCQIFTNQQREQAMDMFHMNKTSMSADAAVEKVIMMNRDPNMQKKSMQMKKQNKKNSSSYYY